MDGVTVAMDSEAIPAVAGEMSLGSAMAMILTLAADDHTEWRPWCLRSWIQRAYVVLAAQHNMAQPGREPGRSGPLKGPDQYTKS